MQDRRQIQHSEGSGSAQFHRSALCELALSSLSSTVITRGGEWRGGRVGRGEEERRENFPISLIKRTELRYPLLHWLLLTQTWHLLVGLCHPLVGDLTRG